MNVELLLKVKAHILEHPEEFDMNRWIVTGRNVQRTYRTRQCGTVGCIAGTVAILDGWFPVADSVHVDRIRGEEESRRSIPAAACEALDVSFREGSALFWVDDWPEPFRSRYENARTMQRRAQIAAERIDAFIASSCGVP